MGRPRKHPRPDDEKPDNRVAETRAAESRKIDEREILSDDNESPLYIPRSRWPDGMVLRWVRTESAGAADNKNWAQMTRVGWSPVPREMFADLFPLVEMPGQGDISGGAIIFGGLCLCQRRADLVQRDRKRQEQETIAQNNSINTFVEQGTANFPRFNQSGPVQYERANAAFKE